MAGFVLVVEVAVAQVQELELVFVEPHEILPGTLINLVQFSLDDTITYVFQRALERADGRSTFCFALLFFFFKYMEAEVAEKSTC